MQIEESELITIVTAAIQVAVPGFSDQQMRVIQRVLEGMLRELNWGGVPAVLTGEGYGARGRAKLSS